MSFSAFSSHFIGGEITWECQGNGQYIFKLGVFRDCNGSDVNNPTFDIQVWNHPTLTDITVAFDSRLDLSPSCTEVPGGPQQFQCGTGSLGGNGAGALEKLIYISNPITLVGVPPAQGWSFTWSDFSRNWGLTNVQTPSAHGLTIYSVMFPYQGQDASNCYDSSPQFGQDPLMISCAGSPFEYNQNAYDPDLDSLVYEFAQPLNDIQNNVFNPGVDPIFVPFNAGFSFTSPTPDAAINPGNVPISINPNNGQLSFTSVTQGNFAIMVKITAYRNQIKISESYREIQNVVIDCAGDNNNAPVITPPFAGNTSFELTAFAGDLINFDLIANDIELLQDGTLQNNTLEPSGSMFGTNFNDATGGCDVAPCATLNQVIPFTDVQGVQTNFNWQTSCDHIKDSDGNTLAEVPYQFVFKVSDNYCSVPKVSYATVTITLKSQSVIPPVNIECIDVLDNDDAIITWSAIDNTSGTFNEIEVHSEQDGLLTTINDPLITTFTHVGSGTNAAAKDYFTVLKSGCDGTTESVSDTIQSIFLTLNNPNNGTAILQWNAPSDNQSANWNDYYHIYREYPAGTWTLYDSVQYGTNSYVDTIDICDAFISYEIQLPNTVGCSFTSNVVGDQLQDEFAPDVPEITALSVDTLTGNMEIHWSPSNAPDTYGYIIFVLDDNGFPIVVDTVYGALSDFYSHNVNTDISELSYTISAFDSCFTASVPPTYQTSAKSEIEVSNFLSSELNICTKELTLNWTGYNSWEDGLAGYEVYYQVNGSSYDLGAALDAATTNFVLPVVEDKNYCVFVKAISNSGVTAFTNKICFFVGKPTAPTVVYTQTATVDSDQGIRVLAHIDPLINASYYALERADDAAGTYVEVATENVFSDPLVFKDYDVDPNEQSYFYKVVAYDSCGSRSTESQISKTILLQVETDDISMRNYLSWSLYEGFDGSIIGYRIYRSVAGTWQSTPIATVGVNRNFEDDVSAFIDQEGEFCYRVEAIESTNSFGIAETSFSNEACAHLQPLIYIPNAFIVGGVNNVFMPVISLHDFSSYTMRIFNRWGEVIFTSNDHRTGWDGVLPNGKTAPEGVYVYVITLQDTEGKEHSRKGHLTLLNEK